MAWTNVGSEVAVVRRRQILVDGRTAMNYATVAPIVERLQKDPRINVCFTASESPHLLKEIYADARPPHRRVKPKTAALMHFDAYLTADFLWARLPRGTRRVQTFHGVAGKYRTVYDSPADSMRGWNRLFFINKRRLQNFIDTGAIDADSPAIRLIGMPRLDCLVDGTLQRDADPDFARVSIRHARLFCTRRRGPGIRLWPRWARIS